MIFRMDSAVRRTGSCAHFEMGSSVVESLLLESGGTAMVYSPCS